MNDRRLRNKERTVQEVLTAATYLFSAKGLHGTSIRDIEKVSGVSKGLIMHHFVSKENLYASVQDQLNQEYIAWMAAQRETSKNLLDSVEKAIEGSLSYLQSNPEFRRINLWSYLEGQRQTTDLEKRFTASLIAAMRTGQQEDLVQKDIKAFVLPFIIRGAIDYWIRGGSLREEMLAEDKQEEEISDQDFVEALLKLILK